MGSGHRHSPEKEGMNLYPTWKMIFQEGNEIMIQPMAKAGISEYKEYWDRLKSSDSVKNDLVIPRHQLMGKVVQPGYFLFGGEATIISAYNQYGKHLPNFQLQFIKLSLTSPSALVLNKNSPFTAPMNKGLLTLKEFGTLKLIADHWLPRFPKIQTNSILSADPVKFHQISLPLLFIFTTLFVSLIILIIEKLLMALT